MKGTDIMENKKWHLWPKGYRNLTATMVIGFVLFVAMVKKSLTFIDITDSPFKRAELYIYFVLAIVGIALFVRALIVNKIRARMRRLYLKEMEGKPHVLGVIKRTTRKKGIRGIKGNGLFRSRAVIEYTTKFGTLQTLVTEPFYGPIGACLVSDKVCVFEEKDKFGKEKVLYISRQRIGDPYAKIENENMQEGLKLIAYILMRYEREVSIVVMVLGAICALSAF